MSKICSNCAKELDDSVKFCPACGAKNEQDEAEATAVLTEQQTPAEETEADTVTNDEAVVPDKEPSVQQAPAQEVCEPAAQVDETPKPAPVQEAPKAEPVNKKAVACVKPAKKVTAGGVIGTIFLSLFLILNLTLGYVFAVGAGVFASDIYDLSFEIGGQEYSIERILDFADTIEDSDTEDMFLNILDSKEAVEIEIAGTTYDVEILQDVFADFEDGALSVDAVTESIVRMADVAAKCVLLAFLVLLLYTVFVLYMNVYSIYSALGKTKRAHIVSGIFFILFGVAELAISFIAVFAPELIGAGIVESVAALVPAVVSTFAVSLLTTVVGVILFFAGVLRKKK